MRARRKRVTDQDRIGAIGVERAVGFVHQLERRQRRAAAQGQRLREARALRPDDACRTIIPAHDVGSGLFRDRIQGRGGPLQ